MIIYRALPLIALALTASACNRGNAPANEDAAATNADGGANSMDAMASDMMAMSGPFADTERSMHQAMTAAIGSDFGDSWVRQMVAHHQGAIDMAKVFLAQSGGSEAARALAQKTIDMQTHEIGDLKKLEKQGEPDPASAEPYMAADRDMMKAMMEAGSDDVTQSFLRKMLAHHKGGIALSDVLLGRETTGAIAEAARKTREGQRKESAEIEKMLSGA